MATTESLRAAPLPPQTRTRRSAQARADARLGLVLAAPAVAFIILVALFPLLGTIRDSLFKISLRFANQPRPFVGLENYRTALSDDRWLNALRVTGLVAGLSVVVELVLGMIIALAINRSFRGRGIVRASVLVPFLPSKERQGELAARFDIVLGMTPPS